MNTKEVALRLDKSEAFVRDIAGKELPCTIIKRRRRRVFIFDQEEVDKFARGRTQ